MTGFTVTIVKGADRMVDEYNGWANWETWNANLWLTNDPGTYEACLEAIGDLPRGWMAGVALQEMVEELLADGIRLIGDEVTMWRIDWQAIADGFIEDRDYDDVSE